MANPQALPRAAGRRARPRSVIRALAGAPASAWRNHRLITVLAVISILPRVLATLAFRPALLIPDSLGYLQEGVHLAPGPVRPAGYSALLRLLEPLHSLLVVTTLQHMMGIATGIMVYALLRRAGLPAWGGSLAAAPVLFDPRQIALESSILPDTAFGLAIVLAVAVLLSRRAPAVWRCAAAGLLIAGAALLRGNGAAVIVPALAYLAVRRVGWRAFTAGAAAFAVPLLGYVALFHADYGRFSITDSDGFFLWSRTMSFANCAVINPPARLRPLCPDAQPHHPVSPAPAWSLTALQDERSPADYLWAPGAWWRHDAHPGMNSANDALAAQFALDAITAQPLDYLRVTARDVLLLFVTSDRSQGPLALKFTVKPDMSVLTAAGRAELRGYSGTTANTYPVQPYAYFLLAYQQPDYFPGVAFLLVLAAGLAGVIRRRGGPGTLPWAAAAVSIVVPVALHEALYRYAIVAVPLASLAAGLAFARRAASAGGPSSGPALAGPLGADGGEPGGEARERDHRELVAVAEPAGGNGQDEQGDGD